MTPTLIFTSFLAYTVMIFVVSIYTSRRADNQSFFIGNKQSPWYIVAYGMIGASLSGVTFMSVPGWVGTTQFSYLMVVAGYLIGYTVIATVLMPLYYRLNLTSIYSYLEQRFGFWSYKTGAFFFLLSRTLGASFRMFLVVNVLQVFVFDAWNIPFIVTVTIFIILIILYTFKGGIKTIIWTDTLQTTFMLLAVGISIYLISKDIHLNIREMIGTVWASDYSKVLVTDWHSKQYWLKQIFSGAFIAIVMTGLDQEMMQKNLSCRNIGDAQKNMFSFSVVMFVVNLMFLFLGATLYLYASSHSVVMPERTDDLFPLIAINYLGPFAGLVFIIGLISAAYPSADGALTSLTTSFTIDILGVEKNVSLTEKEKKNIRYKVHIAFAFLLLVVVVVFRAINDMAVIDKLLTVAGYTYGPLLGLYAFGLFTKFQVHDKRVPIVAIIAPVISYFISHYSQMLFNGYKIGFELLIINGLLTFIGLFIINKKTPLKK